MEVNPDRRDMHCLKKYTGFCRWLQRNFFPRELKVNHLTGDFYYSTGKYEYILTRMGFGRERVDYFKRDGGRGSKVRDQKSRRLEKISSAKSSKPVLYWRRVILW